MKIVIPGGRGQVGRILCRGLTEAGHEVVVLSRRPGVAAAGCPVAVWDGTTLGDWVSEIDGADAVINLAGRTVNCRYTEANLAEMMRSRVESTRVVGEAIAGSASPPGVWIQASTATIYAHTFGPPHDEDGVLGGNEPEVPSYWSRSTDIARAWEATLMSADVPHTRRVILRTSYTMSPDEGGIFDVLSWLVRNRLGGPIDGGRQYISWIHDHDLTLAVELLLEGDDLDGPFNLAAPNPVHQGDFMGTLREAMGISWALAIPRWAARIGAVFLQTDIELIVKSRRVVSRRLEEAGFTFRYPTWAEAAPDLVSRWPIRSPG